MDGICLWLELQGTTTVFTYFTTELTWRSHFISVANMNDTYKAFIVIKLNSKRHSRKVQHDNALQQ